MNFYLILSCKNNRLKNKKLLDYINFVTQQIQQSYFHSERKESLQYIAILYKIDSIISLPAYYYNFKQGIPVKTGDVQDYALQSEARLILFTIIYKILLSLILLIDFLHHYQ